VAVDPGAKQLTLVPGGIVPHQHQGCDAPRGQVLAARGQEVDRDRADRAAIHQAQEHLVGLGVLAAQQESVTRQRFGIRVLFAASAFLQVGQGIGVYPAVLIGLGQSTPPHLITEPQRPCPMGQDQADQAVPAVFFLT
jgi:hypothetical protein